MRNAGPADALGYEHSVMTQTRFTTLVIALVLIFQVAMPRLAMGQLVCNGRFKGRLSPDLDELADILKKHKEFVETNWESISHDPPLNEDPRRANLCEANLDFYDLKGAYLLDANLEGASFLGADLKDAHLADADLEGANLDRAQLSGAGLAGANLAGANLDLLPDSLPNIFSLYSAKNLKLVHFTLQPAGLVKLRNLLDDLGLHTQAKEITCALRRSELQLKDDTGRFLHGRLERYINWVLFDLTCEYGASPERPLTIVAVLAAVFSGLYIFAQWFPGERGGIWAVWDEHRIDKAEGNDEPQRLVGFPSSRARGRVALILSIVSLAAYFSLLSALRIGWSGLNFGTWISRMQLREYSLHASGWVRLVSGLQSLISVYLVALTILTYFGRPFEY
jgi:hypothetical protein